MRWSPARLLRSMDDESGLSSRARATGASDPVISSPDRPGPWCRRCSGRTTDTRGSAGTTGAGARRHHALFEGGEGAASGATATGILHAPGTIGFGAARACVDGGQGANGEQDHGGAHRLHGESPAVNPSDSTHRPYSKIMRPPTTPRRSSGGYVFARRRRLSPSVKKEASAGLGRRRCSTRAQPGNVSIPSPHPSSPTRSARRRRHRAPPAAAIRPTPRPSRSPSDRCRRQRTR
jgi:hypothetical protein